METHHLIDHAPGVIGPHLAGSGVRLRDVVAKVLQECQNGARARVRVIDVEQVPEASDAEAAQAGSGHDPSIAAIKVALGDYPRDIHAEVRARATGVDLVTPRAMVTLEHTARGVIIAGQRHEPRTPQLRWDGSARRLLDAAKLRGSEEIDRLLNMDRWETVDLAEIVLAAFGIAVGPPARAALRRLLDSPSRLVATLAADALNGIGEPAIPHFVAEQPHADATMPTPRSPATGETFSEAFETRISVDEYAFFEAVHPAYGRQMCALANMTRRLIGRPTQLLDVGSGTGLPTVMIAELFPETRIDAVEPSAPAFAHLCRTVHGLPVVPYHNRIEKFFKEPGYSCVTSIGASHHLDTRVFLTALHRLVAPGGLVVVADEMIDEFSTPEHRTANLIQHHLAYIDEALDNIDPASLDLTERERLLAFRNSDRHSTTAVRRLLAQVRTSSDRDYTDRAGPWQRVRFAVLELEALVAGIDYDVERKTFAANFRALARDAGLEPVEHQRVHPTAGATDEGAGTHVFALWRPE